jgi:hypothetical protein
MRFFSTCGHVVYLVDGEYYWFAGGRCSAADISEYVLTELNELFSLVCCDFVGLVSDRWDGKLYNDWPFFPTQTLVLKGNFGVIGVKVLCNSDGVVIRTGDGECAFLWSEFSGLRGLL